MGLKIKYDRNEITIICTLIKNKYIGKKIGEVFEGIQNPHLLFDDLLLVRGGLGTKLVTLIWPNNYDMLIYRKMYNEFEFVNRACFLNEHIETKDFNEV